MATLSDTDFTRVSTQEAEHFADAYYTALNASRSQIASFYVPAQTAPRPVPHITYNGELLTDANVLRERFVNQMPWTHFDPQSVNVHVLNPSLKPLDGGGKPMKKELERNMSLTVQVSGSVRLVERKDGPMRGFSDSFVLVPNEREVGGRGTGRQDEGRRWLIQSQHMRFVV